MNRQERQTHHLSSEETAQIVAVINSGKDVRNVARTLNVHPSTISRSVFKGLMKPIVTKKDLDKAENGQQIS
jgi:IS30 family transposase